MKRQGLENWATTHSCLTLGHMGAAVETPAPLVLMKVKM